MAWYGHRYYDSKEKKWKDGPKGNSGSKTHPVGQKGANGFGLYDMSGNVFEWCWDWKQSYSSGSVTDPRGPSSGSNRSARGGSHRHGTKTARASDRYKVAPSNRYNNLGFRLIGPVFSDFNDRISF